VFSVLVTARLTMETRPFFVEYFRRYERAKPLWQCVFSAKCIYAFSSLSVGAELAIRKKCLPVHFGWGHHDGIGLFA
jgi:hypothetical protein